MSGILGDADLFGMRMTDTPGVGISNHLELTQQRMRDEGAIAPGYFDGIYGGPLLKAVYQKYGTQGLREALQEILRRDTQDSARELQLIRGNRIGM